MCRPNHVGSCRESLINNKLYCQKSFVRSLQGAWKTFTHGKYIIDDSQLGRL